MNEHTDVRRGSATDIERALNVVHVMPIDGIGGAEEALRSMPTGPLADTVFHVFFIARGDAHRETRFVKAGPHNSVNDIRNYIHLIRQLMRMRPDLLVCSLWRGAIVCLLAKMFGIGRARVLFLHAPRPVHIMDRLLNYLAMLAADRIWVDSAATKTLRVPERLHSKTITVLFLTKEVGQPPERTGSLRFVYWGRIDPEKGIDRALLFFKKILVQRPDARFIVIGPDRRNHTAELKEFCRQNQMLDAVAFAGEMSWAGIQETSRHSSYYLQLSESEGMALAVVEAMQLGLVPVVAPAGEIANYCIDRKNCILVGSDLESAASKVLELAGGEAEFRQISANAALTWKDKGRYVDSFLAACEESRSVMFGSTSVR
jgi:glycosyltransferase involved in cell wall biosynthesis